MSYVRVWISLALMVVALLAPTVSLADPEPKIGVVLMHGKGGSPSKWVDGLASNLGAQGVLVANIEMPWSGRRDYDVDVSTAEDEVETAMRSLREQGATRVFVAGHSQGGVFALYFGNRHSPDGVIAIAPGGNVAAPVFREKLGEYVEQARKLIADGKGKEKTRLADFETVRGTYPVYTTPHNYLTWFDAGGAMNQTMAVKGMNPRVPVLFIVPTNDYPGLRGIKQMMFSALPMNDRTKLYEPDSNHLLAPMASLKEIVDWTKKIANP